jgi:hypothetical protein
MKRVLAVAMVGGALFAAAACGDDSSPTATPSLPTSVAPISTDAAANTKTACQAADTVYANLNSTAKAEIAKGVAAASSGDTATAKKSLETVQPILKAASATLQGESDKATDADLKAALKSLADQFQQASQITSIDQVAKIDMTQAENTLKSKCADAGVRLQNLTS